LLAALPTADFAGCGDREWRSAASDYLFTQAATLRSPRAAPSRSQCHRWHWQRDPRV